MDCKTFLDWFTHHFIPNVKKHGADEGKTGNVLLFIDTHTAHSVARSLQEGSMGVAVECSLGADIGTFLEHSSNVAVEHCTWNLPASFMERSGHSLANPHGAFRTFSGNAHRAFRTFSDNAHGAFRTFSGNAHGTFRTFSGNAHSTFRTFYNKGSRIDSCIDFSLIDINNNYCWCILLYMYIFFTKSLWKKEIHLYTPLIW